LLCIVPTQPTSPGVAIGSVAAAATTGALVAMGHRLGSVRLPFAAIGAAVLRRTVTAGSANLVFAGLVLHVTLAFAWSFVFVFLVRRARWRDVVAAIATALGGLVASWLVTSLTGAGIASVLQLGDRIVLALVYASALVMGMRFALLPLRNA
jgi:3-hydroxymyristoyl/3-hydroxydecanoyl-(acyl carrier protein) dehydratase